MENLKPPVLRPAIWLGNSKTNLLEFPKEAQKLIKGIATPKKDVDLIKQQYREAQELTQ